MDQVTITTSPLAASYELEKGKDYGLIEHDGNATLGDAPDLPEGYDFKYDQPVNIEVLVVFNDDRSQVYIRTH